MTSPNPPISRLYSRYLTSQEKQALRAVHSHNVSSEINLIRKLTVLFLNIQQSGPQDLDSCMQALRTYTVLSDQLAALIRLQGQDHSSWDELEDAIERASAAAAYLWEAA
jgi:hypothetical protein